MKNYFEYKDDKSSKFWEILLNDKTVITRYGKIGTAGQVSEKIFEDESSAQKEYKKLIAEKTKKGYLEVVNNNQLKASDYIIFKDFNFKLQVIDHFIGKNIFDQALAALKEKYWDREEDFSHQPIPEIQKFFEDLEISQEMCASITDFCPDGGDDIYGIMVANWDGEDEIFDIQSLEDMKYLSNLEGFAPSAMISSDLDLSPLLECEKLEKITIIRDDISYAVPFLKKGITVNHWRSSIVPMRFEKFAAIKNLFPDDCWIKERNTNNNNEFDDENILYIQGNWEIDNLDLDNIFNQTDEPEHIFTILIEGNLTSKNIFNENTDGGTGIIVLGSVSVDNMVVGGQEIYIAKNLTVNECFWGEYNHGDLIVKGQTHAKVFVATNQYHYEYERERIVAKHFLLDEDGTEDEVDYDENTIKAIFVPEVIITEEDFDDEIFSWENFLDRVEIIENLKLSNPILNQSINLTSNSEDETLKNIPIIFNTKTFDTQYEFENQWQNFDKIIEFSAKQDENNAFEFGNYYGHIIKKSASNKMTFISVDFQDNSNFFIQKKQTEPRSFLEKLSLKSSTSFLHVMYRTHQDAPYEIFFDNEMLDAEVLEKLQTFWFLLLERVERGIYFYELFYQTIKIQDIKNYLNYPVIQEKYNDFNDDEKHGFWSGDYFYKFNKQGNPEATGFVGIFKEIKSSDEFDIRCYYLWLNKHENATSFQLDYCSSQEGNANDRYNESSKNVYFTDWEKYQEVLKWYPKLQKAIESENEEFLKEGKSSDSEKMYSLMLMPRFGFGKADAEKIKEAQKQFGFSDDYAAFLRTENGFDGALFDEEDIDDDELFLTKTNENISDFYQDLAFLFGIGNSLKEYQDLLYCNQSNIFSKHFFVIGRDGGGNEFVEILNGKYKGYIGCIDHDMYVTCETFAEFLTEMDENNLVKKSIDEQCDFLADEDFGLLALHATNMEDFTLNKLYVDCGGNLYVKEL